MSAKDGASRLSKLLGILAALLAWPLVYFAALFLVGALVNSLSSRLSSFTMQQGYWTFIGLMSMGVVPVGLAVSCIIYILWRRLWVFFGLPAVIAAVMALIPLLLGMV